jgi:tetratricopeptide (TPR) repeat protein
MDKSCTEEESLKPRRAFESSRTTQWAKIACALALFSTAAATSQIRLKARVYTPGDGPLIAREQVTIEGAGQYMTDDHGEFEFDLAGDLRVGGEARFHVYHVNSAIRVQQWIVIHPCEIENGRTLSLPAVGSKPIPIRVLPKGDPRLISLIRDQSILECIIEEAASKFKPIARSRGPDRNPLTDVESSVMAEQVAYRPLYKRPITRGSPGFVDVAYHVRPREKASVSSSEGVRNSTVLDQDLLVKKAEELGFTPRELADALDTWTHSVEDSYEKGLAALYEGRYGEASSYISASIPSQPGEFLKRYVPLARAELEQGHYARAESALRKVLAVNSNDPVVLENLEVVQGAAMRTAMSLAQVEYLSKDPHFAVAISRLPKLKQELDDLQAAVKAAQAKMPAAFQTEFDDCLTGIKTAAFRVTSALAAKGVAQYGDVWAIPDNLGSIQSACVGELNQKLKDPDIRVAAIAVNSARTGIVNEFNAIDQNAAAKKAANDISRAAIAISVISTSPTGPEVTLLCPAPRHRFRLNPIVGCNIYSSTTSGGPYEKIASRVTKFVDRRVSTGRTYYYLVKPVKKFGHESGDSNELEVKIP